MPRTVASPVFIGRRAELESLDSALARASERSGVVLIGGESGVGKSRLVDAFDARATEAGARVLHGACIFLGSAELPYAPLVAALRGFVRDADPATVAAALDPVHAQLAPLLPEALAGSQRPPSAEGLAQVHVFEGLLAFLSALADTGPVVLVIEDLQWADPSTRAFLAFFATSARREPVLLVATYRADELQRGHPLRSLLTELERAAAVERVDVTRFSRDEVRAQLDSILGETAPAALVDDLFARGQGNPFFTEELVAVAGDAATQLPESVRELLLQRIGGLSEETLGVMRTAAAAGPVVGDAMLRAATDAPDALIATAMRDALASNVLVAEPRGDGYRFRHALLREVLYGELLPGERRALHAAIADALERDPSLAVSAQSVAAERAFHWNAADRPAPAFSASLEAAAQAEGVFAYAESSRQLERAASLWPGLTDDERTAATLVDLLRRAAEHAYLGGETDRAVALGRHAVARSSSAGDDIATARLEERLGRYLWVSGDVDAALATYRDAVARLPLDARLDRARLAAAEAHVLMLESNPSDAVARSEDALATARELGARELECNLLCTRGAAFALLGARDEAMALLLEAKRLSEAQGFLDELARAYINIGQTLDDADRLDDAIAIAIEGWRALRDRLGGSPDALAAEAVARMLRLGRWSEARTLLAEIGDRPVRGMLGSSVFEMLGGLATAEGDFEQAATHLDRAWQLAADARAVLWVTPVRAARARLAVSAGRPEDARALLVEADEEHALPSAHAFAQVVVPMLAVGMQAEADLAARARAIGDTVAAQDAAQRAEALTVRTRAMLDPDAWAPWDPPVEAQLDGQLCELELSRCRDDPDVDGWRAYADRAEALGRAPRVAYGRYREGEAALMLGQPRERVAEALGAARSVATRLGARPLLHEIEALARRARIALPAGDGSEAVEGKVGTGDAGPTTAPDGPAATAEALGLTDREVAVLRLVAAGLTNKEIAAELFISPKTASVHVSRILTKLGVRSRVEAAGVAHRLGLRRL